MLLGCISTNAQQLLEVLRPHPKADVWDRTHYIASFNHNGANIEGVIDNTNNVLTLQIPYNQAIINRTYPSINIEHTIPDRDGTPVKLTLHIPAGIFITEKGFLTATIIVGNGTTDVYKVKYLDAFAEELLVNFTFNIHGNTSNVRLIASGGVLDKKFDIPTNGELEHQFIYIPVSAYPSFVEALPSRGAPFEEKWLNNNLGANYAKLGNNQHHKQAVTKDDHNAYGFLYYFGRDSDGHEIIDWTSSTQGTFKHNALATTYVYDINKMPNPGDPCPIGYHTPDIGEFTNLDGEISNNKYDSSLFLDKILNLPAAGTSFLAEFYPDLDGPVGRIGNYWTSTVAFSDRGYMYEFGEKGSYGMYTHPSHGKPIRCKASNQ